MTWCPQCGETYRWYERECPTCGVELEDAPPAEPGLPDIELLSVLKTEDAGLVAVARSVLDAEGIEYVLRSVDGRDIGSAFGGSNEAIFGPAEIVVRAGDADRARELLELLEGAQPAPPADEPTEP